MNVDEVDVKLLGEDLLDLLGLVLAQQAVVDEDAGHLLADGTGAKGGHHGGVHATGEGQNDAVVADLLAELVGHGLHEVVHAPVLLKTADGEEEVGEDLLAVLGVLDLGVELGGVNLALGVLHGGHGADVGGGGDGKALRDLADGVAVAHPDGLLERRGVEEGGVVVALDGGRAVLADLGVGDLAAQRDGCDLVAVAEAEHGHAQLEDGRVDARSVLGVDRGGAAGEDKRRRGHLAQLIGRDVTRDDLRVDVEVAHATRDQLAILGAKVQDGHELLGACLAHVSSAFEDQMLQSGFFLSYHTLLQLGIFWAIAAFLLTFTPHTLPSPILVEFTEQQRPRAALTGRASFGWQKTP